MTKRSVLDRPRDLKEDIYDLTDEEHPHYNESFYKYIIENYHNVNAFLNSELWERYVSYYRQKYEN